MVPITIVAKGTTVAVAMAVAMSYLDGALALMISFTSAVFLEKLAYTVLFGAILFFVSSTGMKWNDE